MLIVLMLVRALLVLLMLEVPSPVPSVPPTEGYELTKGAIAGNVLLHVKDNYYDESRLDWTRMYRAGVEALEKIVRVNAKHKQSTPRSLWEIMLYARPLFQDVASETEPEQHLGIEHAFINGMLSTLDPHTRLLTRAEMIETRNKNRSGAVAVESRQLAGRIGYLEIKRFSEDASEQLRDQVASLRAAGVRGLVLDLRNNSGGILKPAVRCADHFLDKGEIVAQVGYEAAILNTMQASAEKSDVLDLPIVVLADEGSSGATEVMVAALQLHRRALFVGRKTFGKATAQVVYEFADGSGLQLSQAECQVGGRAFGAGILPDFSSDKKAEDAIELARRILVSATDASPAHMLETARRIAGS